MVMKLAIIRGVDIPIHNITYIMNCDYSPDFHFVLKDII